MDPPNQLRVDFDYSNMSGRGPPPGIRARREASYPMPGNGPKKPNYNIMMTDYDTYSVGRDLN